MTEVNDVVVAVKKELQTFKDNLAQYVSKNDLETVSKSLEDKLAKIGELDAIKSLQDMVTKQGETITKLSAKRDNGITVKSLLDDNVDALKAVKAGTDATLSLKINKAVLRSNVSDSTQAMRLTDVGQVATIRTTMASVFRAGRVGANSNGVIRYIDQNANAITRGAGTVAEAGLKPESTIGWIEKMLPLEKIADSIPVSKEALADVDFIASEIERLLLINLALEEDSQLWDGDGATPNLKGISTYTSEYAVPSQDQDTISDANIYDLIVKMSERIISKGGGKYVPNIALMNASTFNRMRLKKDAQNNYILPPFVSANGEEVAGIKVVVTEQATDEATGNPVILLGDFNYATLYTLEDVNVTVGRIDKQFLHNMVTILAEKREGLLVRTVDQDGFSKCSDIDAALALLDPDVTNP